MGSATSQPATRTGLRPNRSDRVPAKKLVTALTAPNARMNVRALVNADRWKSAGGQQRHHRPFLSERAADQRVDRDQQAELGQVGAQAQPYRSAGRGTG
jgi:hypothetical protein